MSKFDAVDDYEIDSKIPDGPEKQARYVALSNVAAKATGARLDVAYGIHERHRLDIIAPADAGNTPAILFFHGGYWMGGAKESRRFPATAWNARGVAWVPVEYRLSPDVTLDEIVDDTRRAVAWFYKNGHNYGCDPDAIHVAGNSAGGHITGMLLAQDWQADRGLPIDVIKSGTPVSGLFEFEPALVAYSRDWLNLDQDAAQRNSPIHSPPRAGVTINISWGGLESNAFRNQSLRYGQTCRAAGANVSVSDCPGHDHFSIIGEFGDPESPLFQAIASAIAGNKH